MKIYKYIHTSDLAQTDKDTRSDIIDLYLQLFFETEEGQLQIVGVTDLTARLAELATKSKLDREERKLKIMMSDILEWLNRIGVEGVVIDDASEVN